MRPKVLRSDFASLANHLDSMRSDVMARPGRFELPTLCLEAKQYKTLSAAAGVAYEEARHLSRP